MTSINVGKGLFRLWIVLAACWIGLQAFLMWDKITARWIWDPIVSADGSVHGSTTPFEIAEWVLLPPLLLLLLGMATVWIKRGFRP